ncbi:MAG: alanine racemase [Solobacterium sp.]|nr:alanine racemase [Solobacterium sp.]
MYRDTWFEIDLDAIRANVRTIRRISGKKFIAVLKANAYGCGDIRVCRAVVDAGAEMVAVSSLEEALVLRGEGYDGELLILGATKAEDCNKLKDNNITATAYSADWVDAFCAQDCAGLKVHLKVDTGMNRIGFRTVDELRAAKEKLLAAGVSLEGIFTHFACADSSREMTDRQYLKFAEAVQALDYPFRWIHCDNSDASVSFRDPLSNACRVGISLYGISAFRDDLKPALSMYTRIFHVKKVQAGETIGYGATYTATDEEMIATIPIGYADGFVRANQGRKVFAEGALCEVVGRVCMDQTMIRLPVYRPEGTLVEIFGPHIPLEKMAADLQTIPYEIICLISSRVTRIYIENSRKIAEDNPRLSSI